jgi:hypothetical protein
MNRGQPSGTIIYLMYLLQAEQSGTGPGYHGSETVPHSSDCMVDNIRFTFYTNPSTGTDLTMRLTSTSKGWEGSRGVAVRRSHISCLTLSLRGNTFATGIL